MVNAVARFVYPADLPGGIAHHERIGRHIFRNHRTGSNHAIFAEGMAADNRRIGSYRATFLQNRRAKLFLARDEGTRVNHVGEHHARSEKDIVFADHAGIDRHVVLHLAAAAQFDSRAHYDILPDIAIFANRAALHDVAEMPYRRTLADCAAFINEGRRMTRNHKKSYSGPKSQILKIVHFLRPKQVI